MEVDPSVKARFSKHAILDETVYGNSLAITELISKFNDYAIESVIRPNKLQPKYKDPSQYGNYLRDLKGLAIEHKELLEMARDKWGN